MAKTMLGDLKEFFTGNPSVKKVSEDPALSAELLLLFRMILADGVVKQSEMDAFRTICETAFDIRGEDIDKVPQPGNSLFGASSYILACGDAIKAKSLTGII